LAVGARGLGRAAVSAPSITQTATNAKQKEEKSLHVTLLLRYPFDAPTIVESSAAARAGRLHARQLCLT
jgi:hypothetical protein